MSICSRFDIDDTVTFIREATVADVRRFENRRPDKEDRKRTKLHMRFIVRFALSPDRETLVDLAYLRATNGWSEICAAAAKVSPALAAEVSR